MAVLRLWIFCGGALLLITEGSELTIRGCEEDRVDVVEDTNLLLTCDIYLYYGPEWRISSEKRQLLYVGSCKERTCTSPKNTFSVGELYPVIRNGYAYYTSSLTIRGIQRDSARTVQCINSSANAECKLRIIATPEYDNCSVGISNWMVTGRCEVTGMYSSDNNYTCRWRESGRNNEEFGGFQIEPVTYTAPNLRSFTKGVCFFAKPMPPSNGVYTYSMRVMPGGDYYQQTITIGAPYQVKLKHSCPEYVFEGSSVNCNCYPSTTSSPPALLLWEGMNDATLLLTNVSRRQNQEQFTCHLKWGPDDSIKENTSYKLTVAYGPSDALITSNEKKTDDESETILLTCTATDVFPSAVFQWNVTCYTQTDSRDSSTCYLNFTQKLESLAVLCTASNTYYHQANVSYVYVLSSLASKQANTDGPNAGLLGGVTAAVLLVLIIVAVLVVYIIKRRQRILDKERGFLGIFSGTRKLFHQEPAMSQPYAVVNKPKTKSETPIKRQAAPSGDMYTVTNTTSSGHVADDYAAVCKTADNNIGVAENTDTHQATQKKQEIREPTVASKAATKPKPTITTKINIQDFHGTGYMNVTEVPTNSGLGVYHVVPWATMSGSPEPDTSVYSVPTISEEEYNELHFEEDRTGQENQADNYHHLQIT